MKPLILLCGKSGVGKTTVAELLYALYDYKQVYSHTTRPPRYPGEKGHIFTDIDDMPDPEYVAAYTFYNGIHYWATPEEVDEADIYVVDPAGIENLKEMYHSNRVIKVVQLAAPEAVLRERMKKRGDTPDKIEQRIALDRHEFRDIQPDYIIENTTLLETALELYEYITLLERQCSENATYGV